MLQFFKKFHIITNFPKGYPFYKKVIANIIYLFTGIVVHPRKNFLNNKDFIRAKLILKKGDIALLGNLREASSLFISGPVTHAALYVGHKKFIHAITDGVQYSTLHHFFTEYDTLIIMRLPKKVKNRKRKIREAIKNAKLQIGKPYDFDFNGKSDKFFCTELVNYVYTKAKHDTKLKTVGKFRKSKQKIIKKWISATRALHPVKFVEEGNFRTVYLSHNLGVRRSLYYKGK